MRSPSREVPHNLGGSWNFGRNVFIMNIAAFLNRGTGAGKELTDPGKNGEHPWGGFCVCLTTHSSAAHGNDKALQSRPFFVH